MTWGFASGRPSKAPLSSVPKGKPRRRADVDSDPRSDLERKIVDSWKMLPWRPGHQSGIPALRNASYRWSKSFWSWYSNIACQ